MDFSPVWRTIQGMGKGLLALLPNIVVGLVVFILVLIVARGIKVLVEHVTTRYRRARNLGRVLGRLTQALIVLFGLFLALVIIFPSFTVGDLIQLLGIGGVAIGFAFRDILQNFLAGILLLIAQPFRIGDQIVFNDFEGTVEDIQTRATIITTYNGRRVVIPNAELFTQSVIVNTALDKRRLQYDLAIDNSNNVDQAKKVMLEAILSVSGVLRDPAPDVLVVGLNDNGVTIRMRWWIEPPRRADALDTQDKVLIAIKKTLAEHHILLPIQSQQIILQNQTDGNNGNTTQAGGKASQKSNERA